MVEVDNIKFSYGSQIVLDGISMTLENGKIYGLLGENGVGKTTLLTLLCGLKKPVYGSIEVNGYAPYKREPGLLGKQFYLPEDVAPVHATAESFVRERGVFWPNFDFEKFCSIMEEFETDVKMKMDAMSSGQLKKTYISFALSLGVECLYLDEPTNGLDIPSKSQFRSAVMRYTADDSTIVISTHQVRDLENIIDPIIILDKNEVLLNASIEEISSKLYFDYGRTVNPDSLYSEQLPGGFIQVYPNVTGEESKVSVEALFNAVHKHKEMVKNLFIK